MSTIKKAYEIYDAKIGFVSLVDKAANKKQFLITKAENGEANFSYVGSIIKADIENHYVTGIVYEPMTEDAHGNYMTEKEIEKAAYGFAKSGNKIDLQHNFETVEGASVVESWIAKADTVIEGNEIKKGTWLMTVELSGNDDVWSAVKKGDLTGFSMGGVGKYSEVDIDISSVSKSENGETKGIFKRLAAALGFDIVEKGAVNDKFKEKTQSTLFWNAWYALQETLCKYNYFTDKQEFETNEATIKEALEEFSNIVIDTLAEKSLSKALLPADGVIEKAGKKLSAKNRNALQNVYDSLGVFLTETEEKEETTMMDEKSVQKMIDDSIAKALATPQAQPQGNIVQEDNSVQKGITEETVAEMVSAAVAKALETPKPAEEGTVITAENLSSVIDSAVAKAMEPVLSAKGLPSNLNNDSAVKKSEEPHYMTGMYD